MKLRGVALFLLVLLVFISSVAAQSPQDVGDNTRLFSSGHWVSGEFLTFYESAADPERLFGDPITEVLVNPLLDNIKVQFFQRVRMDYDPTKPAGQRISLANLGTWLYDETERGLPVNLSVNTPLCRHFPEKDKYVCYGFLQFYDRYNGKVYFGEPVSNVEYVNNRLVQYFEHVRFEWRNEMPPNEKVVITEIGQMGFNLSYDNPDLLKGVDIPNSPIVPNVKAFVGSPILASGEVQQINIIVRDQYSQAIPGSDVEVTAIFPDGVRMNFRVKQPTNEDGLTQISFPVENVTPNQVVEIEVTAQTPNGLECKGKTWFRIWW
jgi:hypothetical protein